MHCDIKGDNILVAGDGTVRICDFEMSLDLNATLRASLLGGGVGGTLGFIAPEVQAWGNAGFPTEESKIPEDAAKPSAATIRASCCRRAATVGVTMYLASSSGVPRPSTASQNAPNFVHGPPGGSANRHR